MASDGFDDDEDDDDYYVPPKREMLVVALTPDAARKEADRCRKCILDSKLSQYEAEEITNHTAQSISAFGEVNQRLEEFDTANEYESSAHSEAARLEYNSLMRVQHDKAMTTHQVDGLNSMTSMLGLMNRGKFARQPIDLIAFKEGIEKQPDELIGSGTSREKRIAQFVIMGPSKGQKS